MEGTNEHNNHIDGGSEAFTQTTNKVLPEQLFMRVDGEVLQLLLESDKRTFFDTVKKGLIIGTVKSYDKEKVNIEATSSKNGELISFTLPQNSRHEFNIDTLYQIVFQFEPEKRGTHGSFLSCFDFGSPKDFGITEYSLAYFNYYSIIKERFAELKSDSGNGEESMQQ